MIQIRIVLITSILTLHHLTASENCTSVKTVYTECTGGTDRWKVSVKYAGSSSDVNREVRDTAGCTLDPPVKVAGCDKTCPGGYYLKDVTSCTMCKAGTFSLGNKKLYRVLDPAVFSEVSFLSSKITTDSCPDMDIRVSEGTVVLPADPCWHVVTVFIDTLEKGKVTLRYLHTDARISLEFHLKEMRTTSQKCGEGIEIDKDEGNIDNDWQILEFDIPSKGGYLLEVKSTSFFNAEPVISTTVPLEAPRIGQLEITGTSPYDSCDSCPDGFVAMDYGLSECTPCPSNTYSTSTTTCTPCYSSQYSLPGSGSCLDQVECQDSDYVPVVGECSGGRSVVTRREVYQDKCRNGKGVSKEYPCLVCQPGSELEDGSCVFCSEGTHNKDGSFCTPCPPNTISLRGLYNVWWDRIPSAWTLRCPECWLPAGPFLLGRTDGYLPISIDFGSVDFSSKVIEKDVVGLISIKFELICEGSCNFLVIKETTIHKEYLERFDKSVGQGNPKVASILVKSSDLSSLIPRYKIKLWGEGSIVKIFSVNFTNTETGGSSFCYPCSGAGCNECAPGMVFSEGECVKCARGTYHVITGSVLDSDYQSQCLPCPSGTVSHPGGTTCYAPCVLVTSLNNTYDVTGPGSQVLILDQPGSFPDSFGNTFHYRYKMRLCSAGDTTPTVACSDSDNEGVKGQVCQTSVITSSNGTETNVRPALRGNILAGVTELDTGVTLHYSTLHAPEKCDKVVTDVTLLCNRDQMGDLKLTESSLCRLSFEFSGPFGCRYCRKSDYVSILSNCDQLGSQNITYVKKEDVVCLNGESLPQIDTQECTPYKESLTGYIRRFKLYVGLGVGVLLVLIASLCFLGWYSNSLKHQLDGYGRLTEYASNNVHGPGVGSDGFGWADSEDEDQVYPAYQGKSPGNILTDKLAKFQDKIGIRRFKKFEGSSDIMQMHPHDI